MTCSTSLRSSAAAAILLLASAAVAAGPTAAGAREAPGAKAAPIAPNASEGPLRITPSAGFGWSSESLLDDQSLSFQFGATVDYRLSELFFLSASGAHHNYQRQYLTDRPSLSEPGLARVRLSEQKIDLDLGAFLDLAQLFQRGAGWVLAAGLGPSFRLFENSAIPSQSGPAAVFGRVQLPLGGRLRLGGHVAYGYNLLFTSPLALSSLGRPLGVTSGGASIEIDFPPTAQVSLGYQGEWVALERSMRTFQGVVIGLRYHPLARAPQPLGPPAAVSAPLASAPPALAPAPPPPTTGRLSGAVVDAKSGAPIPDAVISLKGRNRLLTHPDGTFGLDAMPPGKLELSAAHPRYEAATAAATVVAGSGGTVRLALQPLPPPPTEDTAIIRGTVVSEREVLPKAMVGVPTAGIDPVAFPKGEFELKVPAGEHSVEASATGFLMQGRRVAARRGEVVVVDFLLRPLPSPKKVLVVLGKNKIEIKRQVHFVTGSDVILPDSAQLLDEIAATILDNPQLKKIRIEGHTDSQGDDASNLALSGRRARSVSRALQERGVQPDRLNPVGYGETRPIGSNQTAKGRAQNRRVDFIIVD